jgi:hypothetical protein
LLAVRRLILTSFIRHPPPATIGECSDGEKSAFTFAGTMVYSRTAMNPRLEEIVNEIEAARSELILCVSDLDEAATGAPADPGQWSIGEILHHLVLMENLVTMLLEKQVPRAKDRGIGADASTGSLIHSLDQFPIETVIDKLTAPQSVVPAHGKTRDELLALLSDSRAKLLRAISAADGIDLSQMHFPHPYFGRLDMYQWILFVGRHERRHIAQIVRAKES